MTNIDVLLVVDVEPDLSCQHLSVAGRLGPENETEEQQQGGSKL